MTKKELQSKERIIDEMINSSEKLFIKWDRDFDLGLIKEGELLLKKKNWFNELNTREFEVWEYKQNLFLKDFKQALKSYTGFMKKGKLNHVIDEINNPPKPPKKITFKKVETLEKELIKLCKESYNVLVSNSISIPKLKLFDKKFPVNEKDEQPVIDE